jgi:hypothetical protein
VNPRLHRAARLIAISDRALTAARAKAAEAARAVAAANTDANEHETAWAEASQGFAGKVEYAGDLAVEAAHLRTLRLRADAAAKRVAEAVAHERKCVDLVVEAERDRRSLQLWEDRLKETEREQDARAERKASDELAARSNRRKT